MRFLQFLKHLRGIETQRASRPDPPYNKNNNTPHIYSIRVMLLSGLCGRPHACMHSCNPSKHIITFDQFIHFIAFKHSFIHSLIHSFIPFMNSLIAFIHSYIHSFLQHFIHACIYFCICNTASSNGTCAL